MKFWTSAMLVLGLLGSPVGCVVQHCEVAAAPHDCCPRTQAVTACPLDILASAKTAPRQHSVAAQTAVAVIAPLAEAGRIFTTGAASIAVDQRNLHLRNRVLLI